MKNKNILIIIAGAVLGLGAVLLTLSGNPGNMGICIACFERDIAGALGLHGAAAVQYLRPEIIGIVLGALIAAIFSGEFSSRGGSSPMTRFLLGMCMMVGALMFLGCPLRMMLRLGGGDFNALFALLGFCSAIWVGGKFLNKGFSLRRSYAMPLVDGIALPAISVVLLIMLLFIPSLLHFSESGPGSMHAPIALSLCVGLAVGVLAQRSRLCFAGGIRDAIMFRDFHLFFGLLAFLAAVLLGNLLSGHFNPGFASQPVAYNTLTAGNFFWAFAGMFIVGLSAVFLGGCPLRQLILAGSGNSDSSISVLGMVVGAALCHTLGLASSADGPTLNGKIAVFVALAATLTIGFINCEKGE